MRTLRKLNAGIIVGYLLAVSGIGIQEAGAQTLNDAVRDQLAAVFQNGDFEPCARLLNGDPLNVLVGGLADICSRGVDDVPSASVGGGFAGTPPSSPSVVEDRLDDQEGGNTAANRGFFFSAGYDAADRSASTFEDGYSSDIVRLAVGIDVLVKDSWILGVALDGSKQDGDFRDGGDFEIRTAGLTGFGSYLIGESGSFNFYAGYSQHSNDRIRRATFFEQTDSGTTTRDVRGMPVADFDADQLLVGIAWTYDWDWNNVTFGPRIAYDWNNTQYDTYSEVDDSGLALVFHDDDETSSLFSAGLAGSVAISTGFGVVLIDQSLLYKYESDQNQRLVQVSFVDDTRAQRFTYQTEAPDRDFIELNFSTVFVLKDGLQLLANYRGIASHSFQDSNAVTLGFRKEF